MTKQAKRKSLQRWKQMEALGATFLDKNGVRSPVRMKEDALAFFRDIAKSYEHGQWIPVGSWEHRALDWLFSGHPSRDEMCPTGAQAFCVLVNNKGSYLSDGQGSYLGDGRGFAVLGHGATHVERFSFGKALAGIHETQQGQVTAALRHAIEGQVSSWRLANFRENCFRCPVNDKLLITGDVQVDHNPPFAQLVDAFLAQAGLSVDDIEMSNQLDARGERVWLPLEPVLSSWRSFHLRYAVYQFVSGDGHRVLTNRRKLAERNEE